MFPRDELDLILKLIKKYELPLSPILEYAINEKKEEFQCDVLLQEEVLDCEKEERLCNNAKVLLQKKCIQLPISKRTKNVLTRANIVYFKDIPQLSVEQVQQLENCGLKTFLELKEYLAQYSLNFGLTYPEIVMRLSTYSDRSLDSTFENYSYREKIFGKRSSINTSRNDVNSLTDNKNAKGEQSIESYKGPIEKSSVIKDQQQFKAYINNKKKSREKRGKVSNNKNPYETSSVIQDPQKFKKYIDNNKKSQKKRKK